MPDDRPVNPVTPADLDTLSAYLDNQPAPAERAALEARLLAEPNLRAELDALRAVQAALAGLPPLRAPRNLTLTPAQARPVRRVAAFPAFVSGLSAVAAAILLVAGFIALRPVSAPPLDNAVAAAPTATATLSALASPGARALETELPSPQESAGDTAGFTVSAATVQELFAATEEMSEPPLADAALAAQLPDAMDQQGATADSMMAGAAPVTGNSAEAMPTGGSELAMQAPAPQATQPADGARTKEATPTTLPSDTPVPTITASTTSAPTVSAPTAAPTPVPAAIEQVPAEPTPPAAGWLLLGLGGVMLGVALFAGRWARRAR